MSLGGKLAALGNATVWLNSPAQSSGDFKGKVVLVQFWTFTCINWLRTLPYTRAWFEAYGASGLLVVGVHTPEFGFEADLENVERAARELRVAYPIAVDSEYRVWRGFDNQYWPALYLFDPNGKLRHQQFGEGGYSETERVIQKLLRESDASPVTRPHAPIEGLGIEAAADWETLRSGENYLGYQRTENFAQSDHVAAGQSQIYTQPADLRPNHWALHGDWSINQESIRLNQPGGRLAYRFHARDLHLVMGPAADAGSVRFRVTLDGEPPDAAHGGDTVADGNGVSKERRLYQLIRQPKPIVDRLFQLEFLDAGIEAYAFTFG